MVDIIVIGAGTAGLSAAIYSVRAGKSVLVLEETAYGGQIINSPEVANYPGIKNISGFEFATNLYEQAVNLGTMVKYEKVISINHMSSIYKVITDKSEYECRAVILATGAKNRALGLVNEQKLTGAGVSYCATCDGAFFKNQDVAVVGGGNTALEDAMFLTNYCNKVYIIHRRDTFRGEDKLYMQLKAKKNANFILNSNVIEIIGENKVEGVKIFNKDSKKEEVISVGGIFIAIGQEPANESFSDLIELDEKGYIIAGENCRTNIDGIFTAGDCRTKTVRQLTTAAADGAVAGLAACEYIG